VKRKADAKNLLWHGREAPVASNNDHVWLDDGRDLPATCLTLFERSQR
jgi:hypothetical protein